MDFLLLRTILFLRIKAIFFTFRIKNDDKLCWKTWIVDLMLGFGSIWLRFVWEFKVNITLVYVMPKTLYNNHTGQS